MARPTKYHTPEEKLAANRAKSKKSYESRKQAINKKRRKTYAKAHKSSSNAHLEPAAEPVLHAPASEVESWVELATRIQARLKKLTDADHIKFVDDICLAFIQTNDKEPIHQHVIALGKMQKNIYKYQDKILNLDGMLDKYRTAEAISKDVRKVIHWVEEVFCYAIVDVTEVARLYTSKGFEFQST